MDVREFEKDLYEVIKIAIQGSKEHQDAIEGLFMYGLENFKKLVERAMEHAIPQWDSLKDDTEAQIGLISVLLYAGAFGGVNLAIQHHGVAGHVSIDDELMRTGARIHAEIVQQRLLEAEGKYGLQYKASLLSMSIVKAQTECYKVQSEAIKNQFKETGVTVH